MNLVCRLKQIILQLRCLYSPSKRSVVLTISLGPEMKSTGECLGIAKTFNEALYKAFLGAGVDLPKHKQMIITVKDADKGEAIEIGTTVSRSSAIYDLRNQKLRPRH